MNVYVCLFFGLVVKGLFFVYVNERNGVQTIKKVFMICLFGEKDENKTINADIRHLMNIFLLV